MKRGGYLRRKTRLRQVNPERRRRVSLEAFGDPLTGQATLARSLPCCACGLVGWSEAAHVTGRGAGGKTKDIAPLCGPRIDQGEEGCHRESHRIGIKTFEAKWGVDLARVAREVAEEVVRRATT